MVVRYSAIVNTLYWRDNFGVSKFGLWLDDQMHERGGRKYSAAALARDLSVRRATVSDWLNDRHEPNRAQIAMLAKHFGTTSRHIYQLLGKTPPDDLDDAREQIEARIYRLNKAGKVKLLKDLEEGRYGKDKDATHDV